MESEGFPRVGGRALDLWLPGLARFTLKGRIWLKTLHLHPKRKALGHAIDHASSPVFSWKPLLMSAEYTSKLSSLLLDLSNASRFSSSTQSYYGELQLLFADYNSFMPGKPCTYRMSHTPLQLCEIVIMLKKLAVVFVWSEMVVHVKRLCT